MSALFYNIALVGHVIGITMMAGTSFIDLITFNAFARAFPSDKDKAMLLEAYLYRLQRFVGLGMLLILLSGVLMMVKMHEVWGAQTWFRIKMVVLLLIILNGLGLRRRAGNQLKKMLVMDAAAIRERKIFPAIKRKFTLIQTLQLLMFVIIFILSVFKFN